VQLSFTRGLVAVAAAGLMGAACASTPQEQAGPSGEFQEFQSGSSTGQPIASRPAPGLEPVYFDFDRAEIRPEAQPTLKKNARVIENRDWEQIVVEGHTDERGTQEYNLALGERRADSVKRYLMNLGLPADAISTVSYGESQPAVPGQSEEAWQRNRRVEFGLPE